MIIASLIRSRLCAEPIGVQSQPSVNDHMITIDVRLYSGLPLEVIQL